MLLTAALLVLQMARPGPRQHLRKAVRASPHDGELRKLVFFSFPALAVYRLGGGGAPATALWLRAPAGWLRPDLAVIALFKPPCSEPPGDSGAVRVGAAAAHLPRERRAAVLGLFHNGKCRLHYPALLATVRLSLHTAVRCGAACTRSTTGMGTGRTFKSTARRPPFFLSANRGEPASACRELRAGAHSII